MNGKFIGVALFHTSVQKVGNYKSWLDARGWQNVAERFFDN